MHNGRVKISICSDPLSIIYVGCLLVIVFDLLCVRTQCTRNKLGRRKDIGEPCYYIMCHNDEPSEYFSLRQSSPQFRKLFTKIELEFLNIYLIEAFWLLVFVSLFSEVGPSSVR